VVICNRGCLREYYETWLLPVFHPWRYSFGTIGMVDGVLYWMLIYNDLWCLGDALRWDGRCKFSLLMWHHVSHLRVVLMLSILLNYAIYALLHLPTDDHSLCVYHRFAIKDYVNGDVLVYKSVATRPCIVAYRIKLCFVISKHTFSIIRIFWLENIKWSR
jgi:hypothetical protein